MNLSQLSYLKAWDCLRKMPACLAEAIALLHDIGRFMQYRKYRTFFDRISENHARLGIRELVRTLALSCLESQDRRILTRAVSFHNAAT